MRVALRIEVSTRAGTVQGLPRLAHLLGRVGAPGTFFVSMGPDHTGRMMRRLFTGRRKAGDGFAAGLARSSGEHGAGCPAGHVAGSTAGGFVRRIARDLVRTFASGIARPLSHARLLRVHGVRALVSGTLAPAPLTGLAHAGLLRQLELDGHEVALHAWDPVDWQESVASWPEERAAAELERGLDAFHEVFGRPPHAVAAPGWRATAASLSVQDRLGLEYASDCRGREPFRVLPSGAGCDADGSALSTLQVPGTLPGLDELIGRDGLTAESALELIERSLDPTRLNVYTARAEVEGSFLAGAFQQFLGRLARAGTHFVTLRTAARQALRQRGGVPECRLVDRLLAGRAGLVSMQGAVERLGSRAESGTSGAAAGHALAVA